MGLDQLFLLTLAHSDLFTCDIIIISSYLLVIYLWEFSEARVEVRSTRDYLNLLLSGAWELYQLAPTFLKNSIYIYLTF